MPWNINVAKSIQKIKSAEIFNHTLDFALEFKVLGSFIF